jgi:uncharacterized membrane protein
MDNRKVNLSSIKWLGLITAIIALVAISVLYDIPVLRQLAGFGFLTFIPGFLILTALKTRRLGPVEKIVLSVGLSVAFSMIFGLIINAISLAVGYNRPLATLPLLISFSIAGMVLAIAAYLTNRNSTFSFTTPGLTVREKLWLIVPSFLPLLSIVGMRFMNTKGNNLILMVLLLMIPAFILLVALLHKKAPERLYPAFIFLAGISVLILVGLRGNHVTGSDSLESYYVFRTTLDNQYWQITTPSLVQSCLSISILPAVYQAFLNINPEFLFKILYFLLFSISPLIIYSIARKYIGSLNAFLATFFFMSQFAFIWAAALCQTIIAILFFSLAIMVLFQDGLGEFTRRLFFIIFAVACVFSHYSTSYIFLILLFLTWVITQIIYWIQRGLAKYSTRAKTPDNKNTYDTTSPEGEAAKGGAKGTRKAGGNIPHTRLNKKIHISIIFIVFVMVFFWNAQITSLSFHTVVSIINQVITHLHSSFLLEVKGAEVIGAFGFSELPAIPQKLLLIFSWVSIAFIAIGGIIIAIRYRSTVDYTDSKHVKLDLLSTKFEMEYFSLIAACGIVLAAFVTLPYVSLTYGMQRVYFQSLVVASPCFIIGGIMISRLVKIKPLVMILAVSIPLFMCISGTMYQFFKVPASLSLNSSGTEYEHLYISDSESYAAQWLADNRDASMPVYTDYGLGPRILASQGQIPMNNVQITLIAKYRMGENVDGYVYLFYPQVVKGEAPLTSYAKMDIAAFPDKLAVKNKIFTTGFTEIYR